MAKQPFSENGAERAGVDPTARYGEGRDLRVSGVNERDVRAFIEAWLQRNAHVLQEVVRLEGCKPHTRYGAAVARALSEMDTDPRPDA